MNSKLFYSLQKDGLFRWLWLLSLLGVLSCLIILRLQYENTMEYADVSNRVAFNYQGPRFHSNIVKIFTAPKKEINLTLSGIIGDNAHPIAIINNTLLHFGDLIDGLRVVTISSKTVTLCDLQVSEKCITLHIGK